MIGLVIINQIYEPYEVSSREEMYRVACRKYSNNFDALNAYAETSCDWSEIINYTNEYDAIQKTEDIFQKFLNGEYDDYR